MAKSNGMRLTLLTAGAVVALLCIPDAAYARGGGGGGGGGRASSGTSRAGPAGTGSVGRTRTRASGRGDMIRDRDSRDEGHRTSADSRRERAEERARREKEKAENLPAKKPPPKRWPRRRNGRSYTVVQFEEINCDRVERVEGTSYFYCDGAWFEKVFVSGQVMWVEVEKPAG
jgi:hypothetical protein